jgi:hypothetical protein
MCNNQVEEDKMGGSCSTNKGGGRRRRRRTIIGYWWECQMGKRPLEDQDVGGLIIFGRILERWVGVMWTGLVWLRIGTGGELL